MKRKQYDALLLRLSYSANIPGFPYLFSFSFDIPVTGQYFSFCRISVELVQLEWWSDQSILCISFLCILQDILEHVAGW